MISDESRTEIGSLLTQAHTSDDKRSIGSGERLPVRADVAIRVIERVGLSTRSLVVWIGEHVADSTHISVDSFVTGKHVGLAVRRRDGTMKVRCFVILINECRGR